MDENDDDEGEDAGDKKSEGGGEGEDEVAKEGSGPDERPREGAAGAARTTVEEAPMAEVNPLSLRVSLLLTASIKSGVLEGEGIGDACIPRLPQLPSYAPGVLHADMVQSQIPARE